MSLKKLNEAYEIHFSRMAESVKNVVNGLIEHFHADFASLRDEIKAIQPVSVQLTDELAMQIVEKISGELTYPKEYKPLFASNYNLGPWSTPLHTHNSEHALLEYCISTKGEITFRIYGTSGELIWTAVLRPANDT